jgi:folate-binding Fe-S cluster repair protein YgfZ
MKHKTELRKGLVKVRLDGPAAPGDEITLGDRVIGRLHTVSGDHALAYLRFDQAGDGMLAGETPVQMTGV